MEYSIRFIIIYSLVQIVYTLAGFLYYKKLIRKIYIKHKKLPSLIGFSQLLVFLLHGFLLYLPYYLYEPMLLSGLDKAREIIGLIIGTISLLLLFGGFINLGVFFKTMGTEAGKLRTKGLYGISRNPQVVAYVVLLISCALIWPSWYILLSIISLGIIIHRMVLTEEIHLRNVFGEDYINYCKNTPRYF